MINNISFKKSILLLVILSIVVFINGCRIVNADSIFNNKNIHVYHIKGSLNGIAIDGSGNIWVTNASNRTVTQISSTGSILETYPLGDSPLNIAIDRHGNIWILMEFSLTELNPVPSGGVHIKNIHNKNLEWGSANSGGIAINGGNNILVSHDDTIMEFSHSGSIEYKINDNSLDLHGGDIAIGYGAVWVVGRRSITRLNDSGLKIYSIGSYTTAIALDTFNSGIIWVTYAQRYGREGDVIKLNSSGATLGMYKVGVNPEAIATDGSGNVWVANQGDYINNDNGSVSELSPSGVLLKTYNVGQSASAIAIDDSGNVWVACRNDVYELINVATPVKTPLVSYLK